MSTLDTANFIQIKKLSNYRMYYDLETQTVYQERDGEFFVVAKKGELHSVIRGLITADQRFYRRHNKKGVLKSVLDKNN